jgi:aspartate carbamoyltransferase catalytic subunit
VIHRRDLIGLSELERSEIEHLLDSAIRFRAVLDRAVPKVPTLRGQTCANLFFEPSTRTRISFELAEKRMSADSTNFSASGSSVSKGESLLDTALNIQAMKVDILVVRHTAAGAAAFLARNLEAAVVNAGDGFHEHPTQALLDMYTIREHKGTIAGLRVAIIGDIAHSRVARSNIWGLTKMGAEVTVCGPTTMMPVEIERLGCDVSHAVEEAIDGADVIMALRIQRERQRGGLLPSLREYARLFGITPRRMEIARDDVLIMHPGPMNRGVEIHPDVADGPHSVILDQVTNGVAVRMAALYWASGLDQPASGEQSGDAGSGTIPGEQGGHGDDEQPGEPRGKGTSPQRGRTRRAEPVVPAAQMTGEIHD